MRAYRVLNIAHSVGIALAGLAILNRSMLSFGPQPLTFQPTTLVFLLRAIYSNRPAVQIDSLLARRLIGHRIVRAGHLQAESAFLPLTAPLTCGPHQEHARGSRHQLARAQAGESQLASMCGHHLLRISIAEVGGYLIWRAFAQPGVLKRGWQWGCHRLPRELLRQGRNENDGSDETQDDAHNCGAEYPAPALLPGCRPDHVCRVNKLLRRGIRINCSHNQG